MSDFFDPDGPRFVPQMMLVVIGVLFFIGLCVNHWKTKKKREREREREREQITLNPLNQI